MQYNYAIQLFTKIMPLLIMSLPKKIISSSKANNSNVDYETFIIKVWVVK